jgi:ATP-binding cassette, subfamily B, multidrug efflux pump
LLTTLVFLDLSIPRLIQRIIDEGIRQNNQTVVVQTAALMLCISALSALIAIGNNNLSVRVGESVARDLREALFLKIQSFSFGNLDRQRTGMLMVRLTSDSSNMQRLVQVSLRIGTRAPLLMVGSFILMVTTSSQLALILTPILLITMVVIVLFIIRMEPLFLSVQQRLDRLNTVLQENIAGVRVVKAFVRGPYENRRFEETNEAYTDNSVRVMRFMSTMGPVLTVFVNIAMVVVIWAGGLRAIQGQMTEGQIVAFTNYLLTTMTPLIMMTMLSQTWAQGLASTGRVMAVLETTPEVQDAVDAQPLLPTAEPRVDFEHVDFHYNGSANEQVLQNVSLLARPGETIAVLGATGSGKSSLVNLIPRFYDVKGGAVCVAQADVRDLQQGSLLGAVAMVPQETVLFSGTVADNIRYGRPEATDEEVVAAAKAARAHDFILEMPDEYASRVAARGANLSGGQKQRIAIARALLMNPKVLILDDATSSVDVETETKIQDALEAEMGDRPERVHTTFVVAQRISTVLKADKIIVLDRGRIVAEGTHRQLLQSSAIYREIYDSQLGGGPQGGDGVQNRDRREQPASDGVAAPEGRSQ